MCKLCFLTNKFNKPMMSLVDLIERRMFLLIITLILLSVIFGGSQLTGVNKTLGWIWDASNWIYWFSYFNWVILVGYGFLALKRYKSNKYFSGMHLVLILFSFLIYELFHYSINWIVIVNTLMIIIFIINFIISVSVKRKY